jgi:protein-L-isoaspartate(D-aspartate) O-methyltransferase
MEDYRAAAEKMVEEQLVRRGIRDQRVLEAFRDVPRHLFVDPSMAGQAYGDHPLSIGERQTISQPYMVALMLEMMELEGGEKVLEIGTGSGYMTALLCRLVDMVYSIERIASLARNARLRLRAMGYDNVEIRVGDGTFGWPEKGPFDAAVVSAGSPEVPQPLKEQLAEGGRLIIPVGDEESQTLVKIVRRGEEFEKSSLTGCIFVKLVGGYGWKE